MGRSASFRRPTAKSAEFGAFLIAFDGIRHTHAMLVVVKVGGESRHRIVFGEIDFKWSEVVKFHHEMSAARLCNIVTDEPVKRNSALVPGYENAGDLGLRQEMRPL